MVSVLPLRLEAAEAWRRGRRVVGPVDLTVAAPGLTAVIGPNGSGKTSLLRLMHGLLPPRGGAVAWAVPTTRARAAQAFVSQRPVALRRSVAANLAFPLRLRGVPRAAARARAAAQARAFGLEALMAQPGPSLSGGEMQRLPLARALIAAPEILFADEPCAALDGAATREVERILADAAARVAVVLATHDMGQARRLADAVVFLLGGRVHEAGPAAAFFDAPRTPEARAFLAGEIVG